MTLESFNIQERTKIEKARIFATNAHNGQFRRAIDENGNRLEYIVHPIAVAELVFTLKKSHKLAYLIIAALLHDTVEDTDITIDDIKMEFGELVASIVSELTSDKNEIALLGKETYLTNKFISMTSWALIIKLADRLHNVTEIPELMMTGTVKQKIWAKGYALQTKNILFELKNNRVLSESQIKAITFIEYKIQYAF